MKKRFVLILLLSFSFIFIGSIYRSQDPLPDNRIQDPSPPVVDQNPHEPEYIDITISSVGDILIHNTVYMAAYNPQTNSYDFHGQFQYVKPYLEQADVTIANLETTLAGPDRGYAGYPQFNTPDSILDALKDAGIDILTSANNHRMDMGVRGFYRSIEVAREKGLDIIGVKAVEEEKTYVIKDINGIKTAFLNFGYSAPLADGSLSINGLILPKEMTGLMDAFDPNDFEGAAEKIGERIKEAEEDGAEVVAVFMHWGDEYHRLPNNFQERLAERMVMQGADMIFGGHPHVLQPAVFLAGPDGQQVPVFYSQGNFISDQRKETVDDIYTEQGIIAQVSLRVYSDKSDNNNNKKSLEIIEAKAIPTWVNKKRINNRLVYEVIPVDEALADRDKFPLLTDADMLRIKYCQDTVKHLARGLE